MTDIVRIYWTREKEPQSLHHFRWFLSVEGTNFTKFSFVYRMFLG